MREFSISILGTEYTVKYGTREEIGLDKDKDGQCRYYPKEIVVTTEVDGETEFERREYTEEVFRHEVAHAILYESGLIEFSYNELLVNWLSVNAPKMMTCAGECITKAFDNPG